MARIEHFELIRTKPWLNEPEFAVGPTMLTHEELLLLRWLTKYCYTGRGLVLDCGCFLGGSTLALAGGLSEGEGRASKLHSFDLFVAGEFEGTKWSKEGLVVGQSFRTLFDANIAACRDKVEVHEGDITQADFPDDPIELLFIDCAKTPLVNDFFVSKLFPRLIPGRSVVIQQDYLHPHLPWVKITMEFFSDYFECLGTTEFNSVIYGCIKQIPPKVAIGGLWGILGKNLKHLLMQQAINRWEGSNRQMLVGAYASYDIDADKFA